MSGSPRPVDNDLHVVSETFAWKGVDVTNAPYEVKVLWQRMPQVFFIS